MLCTISNSAEPPQKVLKERNLEDSKEEDMAKKNKEVDLLALILVLIGGFLLYSKNLAGWVLIILGILKYFLDKD